MGTSEKKGASNDKFKDENYAQQEEHDVKHGASSTASSTGSTQDNAREPEVQHVAPPPSNCEEFDSNLGACGTSTPQKSRVSEYHRVMDNGSGMENVYTSTPTSAKTKGIPQYMSCITPIVKTKANGEDTAGEWSKAMITDLEEAKNHGGAVSKRQLPMSRKIDIDTPPTPDHRRWQDEAIDEDGELNKENGGATSQTPRNKSRHITRCSTRPLSAVNKKVDLDVTPEPGKTPRNTPRTSRDTPSTPKSTKQNNNQMKISIKQLHSDAKQNRMPMYVSTPTSVKSKPRTGGMTARRSIENRQALGSPISSSTPSLKDTKNSSARSRTKKPSPISMNSSFGDEGNEENCSIGDDRNDDDSITDFRQNRHLHFLDRSQYYTQLEVLGSGSFGHVYSMERNNKSGRRYAVKVSNQNCNNNRVPSGKMVNGFNEVLAFDVVGDHSNILPFFDAWLDTDENKLCMSSMLCSKTLAQVITESKENPLPQAQIEGYFADILKGVGHIHHKGLIHMDLKPENILLDEEGTLRIGDFGLAIDVNHADKGMEGDACYIAPETLSDMIIGSGKSYYSQKADIFSLGLILHEMITAEQIPKNGYLFQAFRSNNIPRIREEAWIGKSDELYHLVCWLLAQDYHNRPSARQLFSYGYIKRIAVARDRHVQRHSPVLCHRHAENDALEAVVRLFPKQPEASVLNSPCAAASTSAADNSLQMRVLDAYYTQYDFLTESTDESDWNFHRLPLHIPDEIPVRDVKHLEKQNILEKREEEMAMRKMRPNLLDRSQLKIRGTPSPRTASLVQARKAAEKEAYIAAANQDMAEEEEGKRMRREAAEAEEDEDCSMAELTGASAASSGSSRKRKAGEKLVSSTNGLNDSMKNLALWDASEKSFEAAKPATKKQKGDEDMDFSEDEIDMNSVATSTPTSTGRGGRTRSRRPGRLFPPHSPLPPSPTPLIQRPSTHRKRTSTPARKHLNINPEGTDEEDFGEEIGRMRMPPPLPCPALDDDDGITDDELFPQPPAVRDLKEEDLDASFPSPKKSLDFSSDEEDMEEDEGKTQVSASNKEVEEEEENKENEYELEHNFLQVLKEDGLAGNGSAVEEEEEEEEEGDLSFLS